MKTERFVVHDGAKQALALSVAASLSTLCRRGDGNHAGRKPFSVGALAEAKVAPDLISERANADMRRCLLMTQSGT